jgi:hypothetical protein
LQDGLREQGHEPIRPTLRDSLEFNDVATIAADDDEVDVLVGDGMLLLDTPVVLAEEVGDEIFELAFDARARGVRVGSREAIFLPWPR